MHNFHMIATKTTEGLDNEGRVVLSCEVWEDVDNGEYAEVTYSSYADEFKVVFGVCSTEMFEAAKAAIKAFPAGE